MVWQQREQKVFLYVIGLSKVFIMSLIIWWFQINYQYYRIGSRYYTIEWVNAVKLFPWTLSNEVEPTICIDFPTDK